MSKDAVLLSLKIIEGERTREAGCNPITKWRFKITTGSRCKGIVSSHLYKCPIIATKAGERMIKKLKRA